MRTTLVLCLCLISASKQQRRLYTDNAEYEFYIRPNIEAPSSLRVDQRGPLFQTRPNPENSYDPDYEPLPPPESDWGQWTEWSFCSRSCGGGVSMRTRRCGLRTLNDITKDCAGSDIQHKICNTEPCPGTETTDFRSLQCSRHNERQVFSSSQFKWTPYYGTDVEPCQLSCVAVGFNFYKSFGPVQDGTRCWRDKHDMCIDGRCLKVGCDQIVGSNLTDDACGVCGGGNNTCFHYSNTFAQLATDAVNFDYNEVAMIPAGATHIRIKDNTDNYLALMEAGGEHVKYIVNGNWVIGWPGDFAAAGTAVTYDRKGKKESLVAAGPTRRDLHVMMLYLGDPAHVEYDYWIPYGLRPGQTGEFRLGSEVTQLEEPDEDYYDNLYQDWEVMETTTKQTTTTTTAQTTTTTTTRSTPTTPARKPARKTVRKRPKPAYCTPCKKPHNRKKHYCQSDFVVHARVSSKNKAEGKRYRHDITINSVYKSSFPLMEREYLWVYSSCCPKLRPFRDYLIMGRKRKVEIGPDGRGVWQTAGNRTTTQRKRFETRLVVDHMDYWHVWKRKYERGMNKFAKKARCRNVTSSTPPPALRDPERRSVPRRRRTRH